MKTSSIKNFDELPLFLNAQLVSRMLGVSPSSAYELLHEDGFPSLRETSCALRNSGNSSKFLMLDVFKVFLPPSDFRNFREKTCVSAVPLLD